MQLFHFFIGIKFNFYVYIHMYVMPAKCCNNKFITIFCLKAKSSAVICFDIQFGVQLSAFAIFVIESEVNLRRFLISELKANDIVGTTSSFFRPLNYVSDTSASRNGFNFSCSAVRCKTVYLLKSDFQPQRRKKRVLNNSKLCFLRFLISIKNLTIFSDFLLS